MAVPLRVLPTKPYLPHHLFCEPAEQNGIRSGSVERHVDLLYRQPAI
jgi:hypothetical protein